MIRKILLTLATVFTVALGCFAAEVDDVKAFFNAYVNAANTYSKEVPNYYLSNAKIIRTVLRPDGSKASLTIPMDEYLKQMKMGQAGAKVMRYKNTYTNLQVTKIKDDEYKVSAKRFPNKDKEGLSCYFIVVKTDAGYKFKVEQMDTKVQTFLKYIN
jgi:hypothetical protein